MKCRTCDIAMIVDHWESSNQATTRWHHCPLCKQVRLTSERDHCLQSPADPSMADAMAEAVEDEQLFAADSDLAFADYHL